MLPTIPFDSQSVYLTRIMNRTARNRFVAWLGIAAMWLAIVAPVISQTLALQRAQSDFQAALRTVDAPTGAHSHEHHAQSLAKQSSVEHAGHHDSADHFDACSYCSLLAHNLPIAQDVARTSRASNASCGGVATVVARASRSFLKPFSIRSHDPKCGT
ncbi:hypothetical protein BUMB_02873c [Candidatus Paraburkholderia calva]|nr:hypothetical protein BUMB_02873c [Candidatus Paraburkholderia calva]